MRHNPLKTISNKIRSRKGESLAETMVSALIAALAMTMLAGALVTAARINKTASDISPYAGISTEGTTEEPTQETTDVVIEYNGIAGRVEVTIYGKPDMESGNVYFYEATE